MSQSMISTVTPPPVVAAPAEVTFLIYSPFPKYSGGRENWLHHLAPYLKARGVKVRVIAFATNRRTFHSTADSAIEVVSLPSIRYLYEVSIFLNRLLLGLFKYVDYFFFYPLIAGVYLARTRPKNLICMNAFPEGLAALVARVPCTIAVRSDIAPVFARPYPFLVGFFRQLERRILRSARKVLANGEDTRERLARVGIPSVVVPNGVDFHRFSDARPADDMTRAIDLLAGGTPVIAFVATLDPFKGVADAIACAAELDARNVDFVMVMAGKGDPTPWKKRIAALRLKSRVKLLGEISSVPSLLQRSSIFLGLSLEHGMSMSTLEAMAAGVPVVARDVPTYRQLIERGRTGMLADCPSGLADCCVELLRDPGLARRIGAAGQESARDYDWSRVTERLLAELAG